MHALFLDTNVFLQCKDLSELEWSDIAGGEELLLLVTEAVLSEIDNLKRAGSSRRARRARRANSSFRNLISPPGGEMILRESSPRVAMSIVHTDAGRGELPNVLDLSRPDHEIIAQAIMYRDSHPETVVALLTDDTNAMCMASMCGLDYRVIPDGWQLEPEPDPRDKEVAVLKERVRLLERTLPEIQLKVCNRDHNPIDVIEITVEDYRELGPPEMAELMAEARERYPIVVDFGNEASEKGAVVRKLPHEAGFTRAIFGQVFEPPSESDIKEYQEKAYPEWLSRVQEFFRRLPSVLEHPSRTTGLSISLSNLGTAPAEHLVVEFSLTGAFQFMPPSMAAKGQKEKEPHRIPSPPSVPRGCWLTDRDRILSPFAGLWGARPTPAALSALSGFPLVPPLPPRRDRHAFYWKSPRLEIPCDTWSFECDEFRHRVMPETFDAVIIVPDDKNVTHGALKCSVSARNLPEPVLLTLPIRLKHVENETMAEARRCLLP